jgi:alkylhydroperoxidase/carboxymuconolactone decarboxylase family protein YurZ
MGILASRGAFDALRIHIDRGLKSGLKGVQILEALEVSMLYGGTESMIIGGQILAEATKDADQLQKE